MIIDECTIEFEILKLLAKLHIVTHEQLFQLLPEFEQHNVNDALKVLKSLDYLYEKDIEIPAPNSGIITGKTNKLIVSTYALNYKGRQIIQRKIKNIDLYFRKNPKGNHYKSWNYHDLLIVQALILLKKSYVIADFYNEDILRRLKKTLADLRLKIDVGFGNYQFIDVEVVVSNSKKRIADKPVTSTFFTYSSYQADIIKQITGKEAFIVTVDGDEIKTESSEFTSQMFDEYYEYIFDLEKRGGSLTAEAAAICLNKDAAETKLIFAKLEQNGHLFSDKAHVNINDKGPRQLVYSTTRTLLKERDDRVLSLLCSNLIVDLKTTSAFMRLDRMLRLAYFRNVTDDKIHTYYIDNANKSVLDNCYDFDILKKHRQYPNSQFHFQFANEDRKLEFIYLKSLHNSSKN